MQDLVEYLVRGLVDHPDDVQVRAVEGEATVMLELRVHPEDVDLVRGEDGQTLRHIRAVLSAASGRRKAVLELLNDLDEDAAAEE